MILKLFILLSAYFLLNIGAAYSNYDGKKIFYHSSPQITVKMIKSDALPLNGCSCAEYAFTSCTTSNETINSKVVVTFKIKPSKQNYGFCTLKDGDSNTVTTIAIIGIDFFF